MENNNREEKVVESGCLTVIRFLLFIFIGIPIIISIGGFLISLAIVALPWIIGIIIIIFILKSL